MRHARHQGSKARGCAARSHHRIIARRGGQEEGILPAATEMGLEAGAAGRAKTSTATAPRGGHIAVNPWACACTMRGGKACDVTARVARNAAA